MKKINLLFLFLSLITIGKINVSALNDACTVEEQQRLRSLANSVKISYEYVEEPNLISGGIFHGYNIIFSNFTSDFYVYSAETGLFAQYDGDNTAVSSSMPGGQIYALPFYGAENSSCDGFLITTRSIKLIAINPYYEDPICDGYEAYELCKKYTQINIPSYDDFLARVKAHIKSLDNKEDETPVEVPTEIEKTTFEKIISFVLDNYMIFLISIIVLGITSIILIEIKKRRSIL